MGMTYWKDPNVEVCSKCGKTAGICLPYNPGEDLVCIVCAQLRSMAEAATQVEKGRVN